MGTEVNFLCDDDNQRQKEHCEKEVSNIFLIELKPKKQNSCYIFQEKKNGDIMYKLLKTCDVKTAINLTIYSLW